MDCMHISRIVCCMDRITSFNGRNFLGSITYKIIQHSMNLTQSPAQHWFLFNRLLIECIKRERDRERWVGKICEIKRVPCMNSCEASKRSDCYVIIIVVLNFMCSKWFRIYIYTIQNTFDMKTDRCGTFDSCNDSHFARICFGCFELTEIALIRICFVIAS